MLTGDMDEWPNYLFETSVQTAREAAHSETLVLLAILLILDFDFQNAVLRGYCCGGWAVSLH